MENKKFHYHTLEEVKEEIRSLHVNLPISENTEVLGKEIQVGRFTLPNRIAIQPMEGCDGTSEGAPDQLTFRRYDRFAKSGAGLIWAEAVAIVPEGRANPRQLLMNEKNLDSFKRLVEDTKETCLKTHGFEPVMIMQETHSGRYSKPHGKPEPWIMQHNPILEREKPLSDDRIVTDEYLKALEDQYGKAAKLAEEAGFDGADIKACHRYLLNESLSAYDRPGIYGGSFENRTRLFCNAVEAAKGSVSGDFLITSRMNIYDGMAYPYGFGVSAESGDTPDMTETIQLVKILKEKYGVELLDFTIGNPYFSPHINRPFDVGPYEAPEHPILGLNRMCQCIRQVKEQCPDTIFISSANSYLREYSINQAAGMVEKGWTDLAGFGRMAFAYPEFASDVLKNGKLDKKKCCVTCSKCSQLMRAGTVAGCVVRDSEVYLPIYKEKVLGSEKDIIHEVSGM